MASFTGLAAGAARRAPEGGLGRRVAGHDQRSEVRVIVGDEVHASLPKALALLGLGRERVTRVPADGQGRMRLDSVLAIDVPTILCLQAGNVNTRALYPAAEICARVRGAGSWVHVDGAIGLWAAAAPSRAHLAEGVSEADSWALNAHKWLNVPYDSGLVFVRNQDPLHAAMASSAAYL